MKSIVGITFTNDEKIEYFFTDKLELKKSITVIVENNDILRLGFVATDIHPINEENLKKELGTVVRIATKKDYNQYQNNLRQASQALKKCRQLVQKYKLDMNVMDATYTLEQDQLIFSFYAETRIDFRDLARELASIYKTRIELHQIGVRDKAKKVSGIGSCGQKLCCSRFIHEFDSVSISMAKNQNLSLNPTKINGVCGRLLCCLKYEDECYKELKKNLPQVGQTVEYEGSSGKVVFVDILNQKYKLDIQNKGIIEVDAKN